MSVLALLLPLYELFLHPRGPLLHPTLQYYTHQEGLGEKVSQREELTTESWEVVPTLLTMYHTTGLHWITGLIHTDPQLAGEKQEPSLCGNANLTGTAVVNLQLTSPVAQW